MFKKQKAESSLEETPFSLLDPPDFPSPWNIKLEIKLLRARYGKYLPKDKTSK
ncbi:MAG: hypothetical protein HFJ28_05060 [Clostridia bacterium]|jgi:hypothetical protein|nr:hypothetical protein [Clostridia bacterium]